MAEQQVLVIGGGPAGLAAGAELKRRGIEPLLLEASDRVGNSWHGHYDRLRLHTVRWLSGLPGMPIPKRAGKWVPRKRFIRYLETYAERQGLPIRFGTEAKRIERTDGIWTVYTGAGPISAEHVVIATGYNRRPRMPEWPGASTFTGELLHSSDYREASPYADKDVLVIGTGNSGAEIAVDLVGGGAASVTVAVRTPPNIMRRDIKGFPSQVTGVLMRRLPPKLVDVMARGVQRLSIGDLRPYGLPPSPRGVYTRLRVDNVVPILDIGLVDLVKERKVRIAAAVTAFDGDEVVLADGERLRPDAVVAATGFDRGLEEMVGHLGILGDHGRPLVRGSMTHESAPGMYFIGYANPISGALREIGIEARRIARAIQRSGGRRAA